MTSLSRQFNFVFLVIVALPVLFVCLLLSWFYMNALLDVVTQQTEALSTQMAQNVGNEIDRVSIFSAALLYDADLQRATDQYIQVKVGPDHTTLAQAITEKLSIALTYTNRIGAIVLYMKDKSVLSFNNYPNIRSFVPPEGPAFDQARQNQGNIIVADNLSGVTGNIGERFIISALSSPLSTEIPSGIDTILVMFRIPYLDQLASNDSSSNGSNILIYSRNGRPILSSLKHPLSDQRVKLFLGQNTIIRDFQIKESSAFLVSRQVESAGWTVATLVDKAFITSKLTGYQWYIYPALIFILGLFFIYEMTFFSRIANPIQTLSSTMNLVGQGNYEFSLPQTGVKEIDQLVNSFNSMVMEIKRLNEERVHREQKRLEAEISALQFQINPHFMANTLNSIRLMAIASKAKGIKDMTQALIRIVADSYATSQPLTALVQEIENVRSYFYIMKVRFGEHIQIDYQIAQETENLEVLRMILQPIVENSILHGFAQKSELGLIKITSRLDTLGRLNIEITDNGVGMSPQRIQEVFYQDRAEQNKGPNFNRIGIKNVQDRIRLHFGNEYGLTIQSIPDQGTTVTFILPGMPVNKSLSEEKNV